MCHVLKEDFSELVHERMSVLEADLSVFLKWFYVSLERALLV